jgi:hypothetical protein
LAHEAADDWERRATAMPRLMDVGREWSVECRLEV